MAAGNGWEWWEKLKDQSTFQSFTLQPAKLRCSDKMSNGFRRI